MACLFQHIAITRTSLNTSSLPAFERVIFRGWQGASSGEIAGTLACNDEVCSSVCGCPSLLHTVIAGLVPAICQHSAPPTGDYTLGGV